MIDPRTGVAFPTEQESIDYALDQLRYGWRESHDATRYCEYEKLKPLVAKHFPGVIQAIDDYRRAIAALDAIFR